MNADRNGIHFNLRSSAFICGFISFLLLVGCEKRREVVLYTSIDQPVAKPIVDAFEKQTGIHVVLVTDTEATKSVGLAEKLRAEKDHPQADVWWGNEPFNTINLADESVLAAYDSPASKEIPDRFKDAGHRWTGNGFRVRVLVNHMQLGSNTSFAKCELDDLIDPREKGAIAIAQPAAGTTGGHVAALYVLWGDERADAFFRKLRDNQVKLLGGNSVVADSVARGSVMMGLTDNDDAAEAAREIDARQGAAQPCLPDQKSFGTLVIPSTVALVNGSPHPADAKQLVDFLLSKQTEQKMIDAEFAYGSLRGDLKIKAMDVDYDVVAKKMPEAIRRATAILEGRE